MSLPLHILLVDDRPDGVVLLSEFLVSRRHRVQVCTSAIDALALVQRHRTQDPYHLVVSDLNMPGMDGIAFFAELRRRKEDVDLALLTDSPTQALSVRGDAARLNCRTVLEKPVDLFQVDALLNGVSARVEATAAAQPRRAPPPVDEPFFGTGRIFRVARPAQPADDPAPTGDDDFDPAPARGRESAALQAVPKPDQPPSEPAPAGTETPGSGYQRRLRTPMPSTGTGTIRRDPVTGLIRRLDPETGTVRAPPGAIVTPGTTGIYKRQPSGILPPGDIAPSSATLSTTTRIRRGVSGNTVETASVTRPPPTAPSATPASADARMVGCAQCGKPFRVAIKAETYTTMCVHCGQLNRIVP